MNDAAGRIKPIVIFFFLILSAVLVSQAAAKPVYSQPPKNTNHASLVAGLQAATANQVRIMNKRQTGVVSMIGVDSLHGIVPGQLGSGSEASERRSRGFLRQYGELFDIEDSERDLKVRRIKQTAEQRSIVRFQQTRQDIPVFGGEIIVQMNSSGKVIAAHAKILPHQDVPVVPTLTVEQATEVAMTMVIKRYQVTDRSQLAVSAPALWIYDPSVWGFAGRRQELVWHMEIKGFTNRLIDELVLVNAHTGAIALRFSQAKNALSRRIYNAQGDAVSSNDVLVRSEGGPATGDLDADSAYVYMGYTYDYYWNEHGRDSIDNAGMIETGIVHYDDGGGLNAYWDGSQLVFFNGMSRGLDVVAHEYTHGVTDHEANLYYYMQSGAINESFSDIWGEFVELTYIPGAPGERWLVGEDCSLGTLRNMQNPPAKGDPDRMQSPLYLAGGEGDDQGGVHTNSGVGNKAAFLLVDGGTFNGYTMAGIGMSKTADLFYEAQTNLLFSAGDYEDLANALQQAAITLGFNATERAEIDSAIAATEMKLQATAAPAVSEFPLVETGVVMTLWFDDMENPGSNNWDSAALAGDNEWSYLGDSTYATSGGYCLSGNDATFGPADYYIAMTASVPLPAGTQSYLHFKHAYEFESDGAGTNYDGGIVEYSVNGGGAWSDAGSLFVNNGYNGTIEVASTNPLTGDSGFIDLSHGYIASRLNLASLAGQSVRFRFRIGVDNFVGGPGWAIDDLRIYYVDTAPPGAFTFTAPAVAGPYDTEVASLTLRWQTAPDTSPPITYKLQIDTDALMTGSLVLDSGWQAETFAAVTFPANDTYYCRVIARDSNGYTRYSTDTLIIVVNVPLTVSGQARFSHYRSGGDSGIQVVMVNNGLMLDTAYTNATGTFSVAGHISDSTISLIMTHAGCLTRQDTYYNVTSDTNVGLAYIIGGDMDADQDIDNTDFDLVLIKLSKAASIFPPADLDNNGRINITDLSILTHNYPR